MSIYINSKGNCLIIEDMHEVHILNAAMKQTRNKEPGYEYTVIRLLVELARRDRKISIIPVE